MTGFLPDPVSNIMVLLSSSKADKEKNHDSQQSGVTSYDCR